MSLILSPMTAERFVPWSEHLVAAYAQDKVDAGTWPEAGALERSAAETTALLPQGVDTPGHDLLVGLVDGVEVGSLWLFTDPAAAVPETFVHDIEIVEDRRGQGLGRALLEAAEGWCADHGVGMLRLHVFAFNTTAIGLYESAGFEVTDLSMAKRIR